MLNMTVRTTTGWIAVVLGLSAGAAMASPTQNLSAVLAGAACVGQVASADPRGEELRQKTADLLRRARQAMSENDLDTAEKLLAQADAVGAQYPLMHMGDTPKKAHRDLELKRAASKGSPARPSALATPGAAKKGPGADPFTGRVDGSILPASPVTRLPQVEAPNPVRPLPPQDATAAGTFGRNIPAAPSAGDLGLPPALSQGQPVSAPRASGAELLRAARRSLAVGDVRRATANVQTARSVQSQWAPLEDSPEKVEAAIRKYQEVMAQKDNTEIHRRVYARMLMEQADALIRSGDLNEAEPLVQQAARQQLTFGPTEPKPEDLLTRISAARKLSGVHVPAPPATAGSAFAQSSPLPAAGTVGMSGSSHRSTDPSPAQRRDAIDLVRRAREAMTAGQLAYAEGLAKQAELMRLPDSVYGPNDQPGQLLLEIRNAKSQAGSGVVAAANQYVVPAGGAAMDRTASRAVYDPAADVTRNVKASASQPTRLGIVPTQYAEGQMPTEAGPLTPALPGDAPTVAPPQPQESGAMALFRQGEEALRMRQTDRAYQLFRQAAANINELDPVTAQRLQDHLQLLSPPPAPRNGAVGPRGMVDEAAARRSALARQVAVDLAHAEINARELRTRDPKEAVRLLEEARKKVEECGLDEGSRDVLLRRADRSLAETKQFIDENRPRLDLDEKNNRVRQEVDRERNTRVVVQEKYATMVNDFNRMMDEQRFAEAEVLAKQAAELDPDNPVSQQLLWTSKFARRLALSKSIMSAKEQGFNEEMLAVDRAGIPMDTNQPYQFGNTKDWADLTKNRARLMAEATRNRSERDIEIGRKLRTPVSLKFQNEPLSRVLGYLANIADVNLHLDPKGLAEEGVSTDTPVTIEVQSEIMLKSALNLILEPLHLSYVVKDEVLKITSEQMRDGQVYTVSYNVADLVIPIPNFVPSTDLGLAGAYRNAMANVGFSGGMSLGNTSTPLAVVASKDGRPNSGMLNPAVMAQMSGPKGGPAAAGGASPVGMGPGSAGGGAQADFDSLIDLITSTVAPTTWDSVGGPGSIAPFETNLSIVVSQTQAVHEQIVDLLEQLRRLQDLQVTIEVRFITLNDNFFERIGVDFDFTVDNNMPTTKGWYQQWSAAASSGGLVSPTQVPTQQDREKNATVGMSAPGVFSADLDVPFTQNSYGLAVPQFGGFDAAAGASLGFAILSDIEAFFFINAAQGDKRTNVLQAPKVTLFNGQQAFISDTSQSPFVISTIPVVGDFAAAQQPVIVVLSEGTSMTVQAVISNDRRFVRLTVVPFFSKIGPNVPTFQFTGSTSTTTDTSSGTFVNGTDPNNSRRDNQTANTTVNSSGTSVQLPTFSYVTVTTTVSVPDGGTVLLGGIKRLSEGRNEFGVPILNKIPYLNRLFKNVGIGRETQSLMMMVTPRIIIQEEEEQKLGI